jgi:hypothetical protein
MPDSGPSDNLRARSFTVAHATGEKRPVVFLHVAEAEIERLQDERDQWRSLARRLYHLMGEEAESLLPGDLE